MTKCMRTRTPSSFMITTVKNTRGYSVALGNLILSSICTLFILVLGYGVDGLKGYWFVLMGLVTSTLSSLHQGLLLFNRRPYTRLELTHKILITGYLVSMLLCILVPTLFTSTYSSGLSDDLKARAFNLFTVYAINFLLIGVLALSVFYCNSQRVQRYLHPYTEIIDGFRKTSGSIQMTNIPSNSASVSSLKQVVVSGGSGKEENNAADADNEQDEVLSPSNKADGSSPRPSKVLKTWPKADPFPVRALYSFKPTSASELPFKKGDTITVLDCRGRWWQAQKEDRVGFIPSNYVTVLLKARVKSNFTAVEDDQVSVKKDQVIEVMERYEERCLVRNVEEKIGAVPTNKLEFIES